MAGLLKHGRAAYENHGCRCSVCREANSRHHADVRLVKGEAFRSDPSDSRHGTVNGYTNYGCRCGKCRAANAQDKRLRRIRGTRAAVSQERVEALRAEQGGVCAACGGVFGVDGFEYYCPAPEGLLCSRCYRVAKSVAGEFPPSDPGVVARRAGAVAAFFGGE